MVFPPSRAGWTSTWEARRCTNGQPYLPTAPVAGSVGRDRGGVGLGSLTSMSIPSPAHDTSSEHGPGMWRTALVTSSVATNRAASCTATDTRWPVSRASSRKWRTSARARVAAPSPSTSQCRRWGWSISPPSALVPAAARTTRLPEPTRRTHPVPPRPDAGCRPPACRAGHAPRLVFDRPRCQAEGSGHRLAWDGPPPAPQGPPPPSRRHPTPHDGQARMSARPRGCAGRPGRQRDQPDD